MKGVGSGGGVSRKMTSYSEDKFNWFLCVEEKPLQWTCCETTAERALNGRGLNMAFPGKNTMAIPINKLCPKFLDKNVIRWQIEQQINVKVTRS